MKPAKEWQESWHGTIWAVPTAEQIQAIQQDAYRACLLRAAQLCRNASDRFSDTEAGKTGKFVADSLAVAIEAESTKGLP